MSTLFFRAPAVNDQLPRRALQTCADVSAYSEGTSQISVCHLRRDTPHDTNTRYAGCAKNIVVIKTVFHCSRVVHSCSSGGTVWSQNIRFDFSVTEHFSRFANCSAANVPILMGQTCDIDMFNSWFVKRSCVNFARHKKQCNFYTGIAILTLLEKVCFAVQKLRCFGYFRPHLGAAYFLHGNCKTTQYKTGRMVLCSQLIFR